MDNLPSTHITPEHVKIQDRMLLRVATMIQGNPVLESYQMHAGQWGEDTESARVKVDERVSIEIRIITKK